VAVLITPLSVAAADIMELHHKKHHQAYVTNYNAALHKLHDAEVRHACLGCTYVSE
jgi:superoxide dismutase